MADPQAPRLSRREFLAGTAALAAGRRGPAPRPVANPLPRWRGFNLLNFFQALSRGEVSDMTVREDDLKWIRDWGFDYVRLPMDYWLWIDGDWPSTRKLQPEDVLKIKESTLEKVDRTVDLCRKFRLHLTLNFHRAPGYCINNPEREPFVLWSDKRAEDAFVHHWEVFAKRYKGVPEAEVSFNLVNEAPSPRQGYMSREDYRRVMTRAVEAIRAHSPKRIIHIDGLGVGNEVVTEMIPTGVAQSVHAYWPAGISHYRASWVDRKGTFPTPEWPVKNKDGTVKQGRPQLEERFKPWGELTRQGIGVHCGETGCYNKTPYPVFLAWMTDVLEVLKSHGIGWALWNLRGSFGVVDSGRADAPYEDWQGHKLDRKLLALLQAM